MYGVGAYINVDYLYFFYYKYIFVANSLFLTYFFTTTTTVRSIIMVDTLLLTITVLLVSWSLQHQSLTVYVYRTHQLGMTMTNMHLISHYGCHGKAAVIELVNTL